MFTIILFFFISIRVIRITAKAYFWLKWMKSFFDVGFLSAILFFFLSFFFSTLNRFFFENLSKNVQLNEISRRRGSKHFSHYIRIWIFDNISFYFFQRVGKKVFIYLICRHFIVNDKNVLWIFYMAISFDCVLSLYFLLFLLLFFYFLFPL